MAAILPLPPKQQQDYGYCLPACAQMVLEYLGMSYSQEALAKLMGVIPLVGVPSSRISRLSSLKVKVMYQTGTLADIHYWLNQNVPVIVFLLMSELPHWRGEEVQHAAVVVGLDEQTVHLMDPAWESNPVSAPLGDFMLAWDELDNRFAVIYR